MYARGRSLVGSCLAVYVRPNRTARNRLGITVGTKLGGAVQRNRVRRRIKEIYRLHERELAPGYDLVLVARVRAGGVSYWEIDREFMRLMSNLGLLPKKT